MDPQRTRPEKLRARGMDALAKALGPVEMARFLQFFELGSGDYTQERHEWLNDLTVRDAVENIKRHRQ